MMLPSLLLRKTQHELRLAAVVARIDSGACWLGPELVLLTNVGECWHTRLVIYQDKTILSRLAVYEECNSSLMAEVSRPIDC